MNLALHMTPNKKSVHKPSVLLIENGSHENETLKGTLESRGYHVDIISLFENVNDEKKITEPDIIILDAGSQMIDCVETLQAVRRISSAPLLVLSTFDQPSVVARTLDCGADDFLTKPVSAEILMANIKKLTRRAHSNKKLDSPST